MLLPAFLFAFLILEGLTDSLSWNVGTGLLLYAV